MTAQADTRRSAAAADAGKSADAAATAAEKRRSENAADLTASSRWKPSSSILLFSQKTQKRSSFSKQQNATSLPSCLLKETQLALIPCQSGQRKQRYLTNKKTPRERDIERIAEGALLQYDKHLQYLKGVTTAFGGQQGLDVLHFTIAVALSTR